MPKRKEFTKIVWEYSDWLYAIRHPHEIYKIGRTQRLEERFEWFESSSPYLLYPACAWHVTGKIQGLEFSVHKALADCYLSNEWFNCPIERIDEEVHRQADILGVSVVVRLTPFPIKDRPRRRHKLKTLKPCESSFAHMQINGTMQ